MSEAQPSPDSKPAPRLGSYLLTQQLGSGGMSNVFRALHEESGSIVAVKVLPKNLARNPMLLQRFLREAKSAESLDHPNIVAIYDHGFDQGRHYLVLEHVEGRDLFERVRLHGTLDPDLAVRFIREVAEGLRYASGRGMIHRDVKPANLLMTPDGHAKIIDLGLALQTEDEDERVTRDGTTVGTVDYMAPEQARDSRQTSERSDIYSLGCTFYYLLTGSAPYPGGGITDKLAKHFKAPIPDVRTIRPEVSESLSLLIRRMMEKKPALRFADYDQFLAALDALDRPSDGPPGTLNALIVDEEDDEIGLAPTDSAVVRHPPSLGYSMAEIADDDEDDLPPVSSSSRKTSAHHDPSPSAEVSLAELAALDDEEQPPTRPGGRPSASGSPSPRPAGPSMDDLLEEDEPVEGEAPAFRQPAGAELPLKTWIAAGVMVGLVIAVFAFGVSMLISYSKSSSTEVASPIEPGDSPDALPRGPVSPPSREIATAPVRLAPGPSGVKPVLPAAPVAPPVATAGSALVEVDYPKEWEGRLGSPSAPTVPADSDRVRVVRRVAEAGDDPQTSSLSAAFNRPEVGVEIADNGPFFEDDCQVAGKSRWIRARPGFRPMVKIEATSRQVVRDQEAKFVLGGTKVEKLVLEGIDLVVDVRELPDHQTTLFLCRGADLTLRDCTLTVLNAAERRFGRFSIFRVEEAARPSRIVLERSTLRGPIRTLVDLSAARAELVLDRSLVVGEAVPLLAVEPADVSNRSLFFRRSVVASRGALLEFTPRGSPLTVRALGSTFARIDGPGPSPLLTSRATIAGDPKVALDWSGEDNVFEGWQGWLASGSESTTRVTGLAGVRSTWPGSDSSSRESAGPWPATLGRDVVVPEDFAPLARDRRATLARIAVPHPHLRELTYASFGRLATPRLSATLIPPYVAPALVPVAPPPIPAMPGPNPTGAVPRKSAVPGGPGGPVALPPIDLTFDALAAPWAGDLGRFLSEKLVEGTTRATIRVRGGGVYATSPIRLPDGLSIAILGQLNEGPKATMTTFIPRPEAAGRSMIELRGGDLAVADLGFAADGAVRPKHWIRSEDGLLAIRHCRFRDPGPPGQGVGAMISFVAASTASIEPRVGPFEAATDRPSARLKDTLIWTGGDALSAELGRGVVDLENCLILSGGPAVSLWPQKVDAERFEADLVLERCTIADDRVGILLGPWPGDPRGPDRPWLVSTRSCVFPRTQLGGAGALLMVDPEAMARGALFWQSIFDAYEVARFLGPVGPGPSNPAPADLKKGWIDLWGSQHARSDRGPDPRRAEHVLRYKDRERPRPGRSTPAALELDPQGQKDLGVQFKDLPAVPKG
jgi:serine/threonine protein kinase